ncbi:putative ankyrin repeat protein [Powai lake megavirus]|uniref:Putative ankyrin repeat protein n=1 Tax=Powai lake megavirus TaxID=1842663 RepID=A0A167RJK2_9VIRU|nr:putative ankyrin repeat protein [Powai lake megavirus]ANB50760.1 putative ankyrin repeat protein [Powai lake megavirus]
MQKLFYQNTYDYNYNYPCNEYVTCKYFTKLMYLIIYEKIIDDCHNKIIKEIKLCGNNIDAKNELGWTALMLAARNSKNWSSIKTVKLLLDAGADPNIYDRTIGNSILSMCVASSNKSSSLETVILLLDKGANINYKSLYGWTSLMLASRNSYKNSNIDTVKILLQYGADIDAVNNYGRTALMCAIHASDTQISTKTIEILLEAGAKIDLRDFEGTTALIFSTKLSHYSGNIKIIQLLLDYGADYNIKDNNNKTFFDYLSDEYKNSINKIIIVIEKSKTIKKHINKIIINNTNEFIYRPNSLRSKILNIKWNLDIDSYNYVKITDPSLIDYLGIYNDTDFVNKIIDHYQYI